MRRCLLIVVAVSGCGMPEQLLRVSASVDAYQDTPEPIDLTLESDEGLTPDGCGPFTHPRQLHAAPRVAFDFDVVRGEAIGPRGTPRCYRLDWQHRSSLTFGPVDHDLELPRFTVWPKSDPSSPPESLFLFLSRQFVFRPMPEMYVHRAEDELMTLPPKSFVSVIDDRGAIAWQLHEGDALGSIWVQDEKRAGTISGYMIEDHAGQVQAGSFRVGHTYATDAVGRALEMRFEYRMLTNKVVLPPVDGFVPASRGAACDGYDGGCPFTDGDFAVVEGPLQQVSIDLGRDVAATTIMVRGLWPSATAAFIVIELAPSDPSVGWHRIQRSLTPDQLIIYRDGAQNASRLDLQIYTLQLTRYARLSLVDDLGNTVPIGRLAELSLFDL